jgi:alkylation response protein AidB-like acyl-CoA dehydrogenase
MNGRSTGAGNWIETARALGPVLAERAAAHDESDSFVAENYTLLKERGLFAAGVPAELGGGDASHGELCAIVRELAHHCSATALAFSMHTHLVATLAYGWRGGNKVPEAMLRRVAAEGLVLVSTGGSDWLAGSGTLERVEGGFRMTGRKRFGSGLPGADLLMTGGIYDDPVNGPTVIHFPVPLDAPGVRMVDTWRVLGMRGSGSHDVLLENVFIPEAAASGVRRPAGKWHPFMHTVTLIAMPIFYAAYLGVAEAARDLAIATVRRKAQDGDVALLVGEMENQLVTAQLAHASLVAMAGAAKPGPEATAAAAARRTILVNAVLRTVDKAMEVAGGGAFYRAAGLERLFRDAQGVRYHPIQEKPQTRLTGRFLLGMDLDG